MSSAKKSDRILCRATTGVILPPEASTSWVLDHALLWQAVQGDCVVIDIADVRRYQRLASQSYVDFLVAYVFALMINQQILCPVDYRQYLPVDKRREISGCAQSVAGQNVRDGKRLYELAIHGYRQYIGYARGEARETLYGNSGSERELKSFAESKRIAMEQLDAIEHEVYEKAFLEKYANRLVTKCLAAREIAGRLFRQYGVRLRVFDSPEYTVGADLLTSRHVISGVHRDQDFSFADLGLAREIREREATFAGGGYTDSMVYTAVAAALRPDLYRTIRQQMDAGPAPKPDVRRIVNAACLSTRETLSNRRLHQTLVRNLLSLFSGVGTWPALASVAQLLGGLIHFRLARSDSERLMTKMAPIDEFILLSTHVEQSFSRRRNATWWGNWIRYIFRQPLREDYRWQVSQKTMGTWVETGIYVPWFEDFKTP